MKKIVFLVVCAVLVNSAYSHEKNAHENEQESFEETAQEGVPAVAINFIVNNSQSGDQINTNLSSNEQKVTTKEKAKEEAKKDTNKMPMGILYLLSAIFGSTIGGSGSSNSNQQLLASLKNKESYEAYCIT